MVNKLSEYKVKKIILCFCEDKMNSLMSEYMKIKRERKICTIG